MKALEAEPEEEAYKPPEQFRDHARRWAMSFRVVHFDEVKTMSEVFVL